MPLWTHFKTNATLSYFTFLRYSSVFLGRLNDVQHDRRIEHLPNLYTANLDPLLRPPCVPSKSGLNRGVILIVNSGCCETSFNPIWFQLNPSVPQRNKDHHSKFIKTAFH